MFSVHDRSATGKPYGWCTVLKLGHLKLYKVAGIEVLPKFSSEPLFAVSFSDSMAGERGHPAEIRRVRLFCVGGPEGSRRGCERHGKSYLTLRRRGEAGDGGGSLTGGAIPSA